jgi:hypothetical protein
MKTKQRTIDVTLTKKEIEFLLSKIENLRNFEVPQSQLPACRSSYKKLTEYLFWI